MITPPDREAQILHYHHVEKCPIGTIAEQLHVHHSVVRRVLAQAGVSVIGPRPSQIDIYVPFIRQTLETFPKLPASRLHTMLLERGYNGSPDHFRHLVACMRPQIDLSEWMLHVLQKKISMEDLRRQTGHLPDLEVFLGFIYKGSLRNRNKSLAILAYRRGITIDEASAFLGISTNTYFNYKRIYLSKGTQALFSKKLRLTRKCDNETLKSAVFKVLHEPPSNHGINRTTWTMPLLRQVLSESGNSACPEVIRSITRSAGYRWRKARVVLTSNDPAYSEKLTRIQSILAGLQLDEAFFSIDEYGPFAIKKRGGRKLTAPDKQNIVPQWQTSRGSLILTAALELSSNQVVHFFSSKKNTAEMIKMMDILIDKYSDRKKIYISWDAASWHISKKLGQRIEEHNGHATKNGCVVVEATPLPSGAQFLNVIESVFSGMSRAIIHNSDYSSLDDAKAAINRYFEDRNTQFQQNPRRAGQKIWGKEREPATFSASSNCKDPRYR